MTFLPDALASFLIATWLILAQSENPLGGYAPILNLVGIPATLAYVLVKLEPRLRAMEAAIDRNSRAKMLVLLSLPYVPEAVKEQAKGIISEIDSAETTRKE